jgi:hypothetical protein
MTSLQQDEMMEEPLHKKRQASEMSLDLEVQELTQQDWILMVNQIKTMNLQIMELQTALKVSQERIIQLESNQQKIIQIHCPIQSDSPVENLDEELKKDIPTTFAAKVAQSRNETSQPQESFKTVVSKREKKRQQLAAAAAAVQKNLPSAQSTVKKPISHLRTALKKLSTTEDILKGLIQQPQEESPQQPAVEKKVENISRVYLQAQLNKPGMREPLFAFSTIFETITKVKPLGISLTSRNVAEIFFPSSKEMEVKSLLPPEMIVVSTQDMSSKDVKRRAASYNRGFFKLLRRASLDGFQNILAMEVLETAEASISNLPHFRQHSVRKAIAEDKEWVMSW